jgi:uncharacterized protein (DUF2141 family)
MKLKFWLRLLILTLTLFSIRCAKRGFPPGGPPDLTPPQVLEVFPANSSLNVNISAEVILYFSEGMDKESTEKSIFITPVPEAPFEFKWKKNNLMIKPSQPLEKDRTYVMTLGTNAQDLHNNKLEKSYSFAFSTGEKLDSGFISGEVFFQSKKEKSISIWGYPLSKIKEPDPVKNKPEYVTLSGEDGTYTLSYLSKGAYRLFAVKDINGDLMWNPDNEPLGITTKDLYLTDDSLTFSHINFNLILRDTIPPALLDCQSLDKNKLRLEFSEPMSKRDLYVTNNYMILSDSLPKETLTVQQVYLKDEDYKKVYLVTEKMSKIKYRVYVEDLYDSSGNSISRESNECIFEGTELEDKSPLQIIFTSLQSNITNIPLDTEIKLFFDKPPEKTSAEKGFILEDSMGGKVVGNFSWENPAALVFIPERSLQAKMKYRLSIKDVFDLWDNPLADTSFEIGFYTLNPDTLGSLSGKAENLGSSKGEIIIILEKAQAPEFRYEKKLKEPGEFRFDNVFPGKYNLSAYLDLNQNSILDQGKPFPFEPAEPQVVYPDTLNIRPRWETEGVILKFR